METATTPTTSVRKDPHYGWKARTRFSLGMVTQDGKRGERVLTFKTSKRYSGGVSTIAIVSFLEGGFESHKMGLGTNLGDYSNHVIVENRRATEKAVREQHDKALKQSETILADAKAFYASKGEDAD